MRRSLALAGMALWIVGLAASTATPTIGCSTCAVWSVAVRPAELCGDLACDLRSDGGPVHVKGRVVLSYGLLAGAAADAEDPTATWDIVLAPRGLGEANLSFPQPMPSWTSTAQTRTVQPDGSLTQEFPFDLEVVGTGRLHLAATARTDATLVLVPERVGIAQWDILAPAATATGPTAEAPGLAVAWPLLACVVAAAGARRRGP